MRVAGGDKEMDFERERFRRSLPTVNEVFDRASWFALGFALGAWARWFSEGWR